MIRGTLRLGRYAARASVSRGPKQPPKRFGPVGTILTLLVVVAIASLNWTVSLIVLGVMLFLVLPLALAGGSSHRTTAQAKPDPLDTAMAHLTSKDK